MTKQQLIEDNLKLVHHVIHKYYPANVGDEDIVQCGMLGLCNAADKWDESKSKFSTFACSCIKNEIRHEFRRRSKHQGILSLDYEVFGDDGEKGKFGDFIIADTDVEYVDIDYRRLSKREQQICELCKQGMSYADIGRKLGISRGAVWKASRKIRKVIGVDR